MLSSLEKQTRYHAEVPMADVPCELISIWFDDGFYVDDVEFRNLFSDYEWNTLLEFNDFYESILSKLPEQFEALIISPYWLDLVEKAKELLARLEGNLYQIPRK